MDPLASWLMSSVEHLYDNILAEGQRALTDENFPELSWLIR